MANQRHRLARLDEEAHGIDMRTLAIVREADALKGDRAARTRQRNRARTVPYRRHGIENLEEFSHLGRLHEQAIDEMNRLFQAPDQHRGQAHERDDLADRGKALHMQPCAEQEDRRHRQRRRGTGGHRRQRPPGQDRYLRGQKLPDNVAQGARLRLDAREALDHRHVAERVGGMLGEIGMVAFDRALQRLRLAQDKGGQGREHDDENEQQQTETPVEEQGQRQEHDKRQDCGEMLAEEPEP